MSQLSLYSNGRGHCVIHYEGFSWLAAIMPLIWALQRRLYLVAGFCLVYSIGYAALIPQLGGTLKIVLYVAQIVIFGSFANRIHRALLERNGWIRTEEETISADEKEA